MPTRTISSTLLWWVVENLCIWLPCFLAAAMCPIPGPDATFFEHFWFYLSSGTLQHIYIILSTGVVFTILSCNLFPSLPTSTHCACFPSFSGTITIEGGFMLSHLLVHTVFHDVPRFATGGYVFFFLLLFHFILSYNSGHAAHHTGHSLSLL